jgi:hypothetical protein
VTHLRQRAVTLIEAVLFIAIALGLIVGGLVFFEQASIARQTTEFSRLVNAVATESMILIRREYDMNRDARDDLAPYLVTAGAVPPSYAGEDSTGRTRVLSPWGGAHGHRVRRVLGEHTWP